jgi:hypothetical protein
VQVFAVGNTGMRVVHYLPNYWLAREIAKGVRLAWWRRCCCGWPCCYCFAP